MSDSKGAAIKDKVIEVLGEVYYSGVSDHNSPQGFDTEAVEAILAILAQEVKRAYDDGYAKGWNTYNEADYNPNRERLG